MKTSLVVLLCLILTVGHAQPNRDPDITKKIDIILGSKFLENGPGGTALVMKEGEILYDKAFGKADLELDVAMKTAHVFRIGSITKQFTACAIMKLAEQNKLSLRDSISKFIDEYPAQGRAITIEHLLTHTSGVRNITGMQSWTSEVQRRDFSTKEVVDFFKNEPLDFETGTSYRYSNSNYILLGYIIELVTKMTYCEYVSQNFFKPLGMTATTCDIFFDVIPNRVKGYERTDGHYSNAAFLSMTQPSSAGAIVSNTKDLYIWHEAVMSNKVIRQDSRERAQTPFRLSNGELTNYGYGWELGNIQGSSSIKHGGKINGFITYSLFLPREKVFVALLSNCECTPDVEMMTSKMAALAINKPFEWTSVQVDTKKLQQYEGVYQSQKGDERIVSLEAGRLLIFAPKGMKSQLIPFTKDKFQIENTLTTIHFSRDQKRKVSSFIMNSTERAATWNRSEKRVIKLKSIEVVSHALDRYVGKYQFGPAYFEITKDAGKLYGKAPGESESRQEIIPFDKHKFFAKNIDAQIRFNVDDKGNVISLTIIQNGEKTAPKLK